MPRDILPFRATGEQQPVHADRSPDVAFAALPLLRQLRDELERAARRARAETRWGVPPLFFFDKEAQAEWTVARGVAPVMPRAAVLAELADDALMLLADSVEVRRTA